MARGAVEFDSLDGFLGHKTRGSSGTFLTGWKKKGTFDSWMHTKRLPLAIWRHSFPMYVVKEDRDKDESVKHVYNKQFVCHETEEVLTHPWRDKDTSEREKPPERCGICKFEDWCWMQCVAWVDTHRWDAEAKEWVEKKKGKGKGIDPCTAIFDFKSDASDDENVKIVIGAFCNYLGQKKLPTDVAAAAKASKIRLNEIFKQVARAKCQYILCVVDNNDVKAGVQIAFEAQALGEKIKEVITKAFKSDDRNIMKAPYLIQWEYKEEEEFSKKYDATPMFKIKPSERVLKLIRGEAPDLEEIKTPFNQQTMRSVMERHCLISDQVPWDELFPTKEQSKKWEQEDESADDEEEEESEEEDKSSSDSDDESESAEDTPKKKSSSKKSKDDEEEEEEEESEEEEDDEEMVKCDECKKPMKLSATKCPHCGHKYEESGDEEEEEEEKPKLKSRSEKTKEKASTKSKSKAKDDEDEDEEDEDDEDEEEEEEEEKPAKKKASTKKSKSDEEDDSQGDEIPFD